MSIESERTNVNVKAEFSYFNILMSFTSNKKYFHPQVFLKLCLLR